MEMNGATMAGYIGIKYQGPEYSLIGDSSIPSFQGAFRNPLCLFM